MTWESGDSDRDTFELFSLYTHKLAHEWVRWYEVN